MTISAFAAGVSCRRGDGPRRQRRLCASPLRRGADGPAPAERRAARFDRPAALRNGGVHARDAALDLRARLPRLRDLFCLASADDPIAPLVSAAIAANPGRQARLLIGDDRLNGNPKLNNMAKGWKAARYDWVIFADSNVLMPPDYIQRLLARWRPSPASSPRRRSDRGRNRSAPRSNAPSSTPTRRAGNMPRRRPASASPRARRCCGGETSWRREAASKRSGRRSRRTRLRPSSSTRKVSTPTLSARRSSSRWARAD